MFAFRGFIRRARVGVLVVAAATVVGSAGLGALPAGADSPGSGSWGIWYGLGGPIISDPAPVVTTGQIDVFGVNPNDQQLYEASNAGGSWSGWGKVGVSGTYSLSSKVTAVLDASGNIHVFGTGTGTASNTAYELVYTPGSGWGTWQNRGGPVVGAPSAVLTGGQLDLFATFTDNTVHETSNSGNGWSKWGPVTPSSGSGSLSSSPSAVVDASGGIDIFGLGTGPGTNTVYELSYTAASGWGSWQSVSPAGKLLDTPTAVLSFGHLDLFGVGTNNTLYETSPSGSSWSPWAAVPAQNSGSLGTGAEAVTESNGNIDVFGTGTNAAANNVYTLAYTAPPPPPPTKTGATALGNAIAQQAISQSGTSASPSGTLCNPYSAYWQRGGSCSNGYRSEDWCADFAEWVWKTSGAEIDSNLGNAALDFETWAKAHGTWHPVTGGEYADNGYLPSVGDAVVYSDGQSHVGIVVSETNGLPNVVSGNFGDAVSNLVDQLVNQWENPTINPDIIGYASPIAAS